jgi:hypothetical protein
MVKSDPERGHILQKSSPLIIIMRDRCSSSRMPGACCHSSWLIHTSYPGLWRGIQTTWRVCATNRITFSAQKACCFSHLCLSLHVCHAEDAACPPPPPLAASAPSRPATNRISGANQKMEPAGSDAVPGIFLCCLVYKEADRCSVI